MFLGSLTVYIELAVNDSIVSKPHPVLNIAFPDFEA
jgi:hypothetical protein